MSRRGSFGAWVVALAAIGAWAPAAAFEPPAKPCEVDLSVSPAEVAAGASVRVTVALAPIRGVKVNRYPRIELHVPQRAGLVREARVAIGDPAPPPPEKLASNYFHPVDPVKLELTLEPDAAAGRHEIGAELTYSYCMPANGFCARKRVPLKIPITVR